MSEVGVELDQHTRREIAQIWVAEREGTLSREEAKEAIERIKANARRRDFDE